MTKLKIPRLDRIPQQNNQQWFALAIYNLNLSTSISISSHQNPRENEFVKLIESIFFLGKLLQFTVYENALWHLKAEFFCVYGSFFPLNFDCMLMPLALR